MSCHAILKNLYEPKMDVILTISFKITAEIEVTKHMLCVLLCTRFVKHNFVLSFIHCNGICVYIVFFFTVNSSVNAARSSCRRKFHGKGIELKTFPQGYVISRCGVVVRFSRVLLNSFYPSFFFPCFLCCCFL